MDLSPAALEAIKMALAPLSTKMDALEKVVIDSRADISRSFAANSRFLILFVLAASAGRGRWRVLLDGVPTMLAVRR